MTDFLLKTFINNKNTEDVQEKRSAIGTFSSVVGIICNAFLFIIKIVIGIISGSVAITADAVNNLTDASSTVVTFIGFKLSKKPADADHPYGHGRYEYLSALGVCVVILIIGVELLKTSISKIIAPQKINFSLPVFIILFISVIIKLWMAFFYKKTGKLINSNTLIATSVDSRNDVISTSAVFLALVISYFSKLNLDGYIGVLVALFILFSGIGLLKDTLNPMIGTTPDKEFVVHLKDKIMSYDKVLGIHDLMIHDYGPMRKFASVHIEMAAEEDVILSHDIIDNIETDFLQNDGVHLTIHYDPVLTKDPFVAKMNEYIRETVKKVDERLSVHDLRVVPGKTHTNIIFDCVADFDVKLSNEAIKKRITEIVKKENISYNPVITIDRGSLL